MRGAATRGADPVMVAVGTDARTLRLVHTGFRMAGEQMRPWIAVHVEAVGSETAEAADQARVWLQEAQELGAEAVWVRSSNVVSGLVAEVKQRRPSTLVMGTSRRARPWTKLEGKAREVARREPGVHLFSLALDVPAPVREPQGTPAEIAGVLAAIATLLLVGAIFASSLEVLAGFPAVPAVFGIATAFIGHRWGRWASLSAVPASVLLFLFPVPRFQFSFPGWPRFFYFLGTVLLARLLMDLVDRLRRETYTSRRREAETVLLHLFGRALARCSTLPEAACVVAERFRSMFQAEAWLLIPGEEGAWTRLPESSEAPPSPPPGELLPMLVPARLREDPLEPLFIEGCGFVALASARATEGVLQIRSLRDRRIPQESWGSLQAFAIQVALAIERIRWLEAARQAQISQETERLRSSLLSSISHDLRTPLAAIQGASSSLLLPTSHLPESAQRDMLVMIHDESRRLGRLLSDLLDLTRLESGVIRAQVEWQPLDEVVGAALGHLEAGRGSLDVKVRLPDGLALVPLDSVLAEQLLINLLSNAHRHAPDSPVTLEAWIAERSLELSVRDEGPGIPEEFRERIFEKFFRLPSGEGGSGLGLAICDAIARAHGGRIWAESSPSGGATFRVSLPMEDPPPDMPTESQPCPCPPS